MTMCQKKGTHEMWEQKNMATETKNSMGKLKAELM